MRIALIHNRLYRLGGLETRLFSYIERMRALGHQVTLITYKIGEDVKLPEDVRVIRVDMGMVPKPLRDFWLDWKLKGIMKRERFDFSLSLTKTSNQDAVLAAGNHIGFLKATSTRKWHTRDKLSIASERRAFHKAKVVLAASKMMKDELVQYYDVPAEKIELLYPPTDTARFYPGLKAHKQEFRERFGCKPDTVVCSFVSVSHGRKGLPLLYEVFRKLGGENIELLVAGPNPIENPPPNVRYVGYVTDTEKLYTASDMFLLPANYEPYGQVVSEAIMCGTPALISHMVGAKELVTGEYGQVIASFSVDDWLAAIRRIATNSVNPSPDFAQKNGLSVEAHVGRILQIAEKLAAQRK